MANRPRPANTWTTSVFNPGFDKRIPLGFVEMVYDKKTGNPVGYMRNGKFYQLGVDAATYDKEQAKEAAKGDTFDKQQEKKKAEAAAADPIGQMIGINGLSVTTDPNNGTTYVSGITNKETGAATEHFIYLSTVKDAPFRNRTTAPGASEVNELKPGASQDYKVIIRSDYDDIRNAILTEAQSTPGGVDTLFATMYNAGLISKETFQKKDFSTQEFNKGLQYAVRNYSVSVVDDYTVKGIKEVKGFLNYLGTDFQKAGPTSRTTYESVTTLRHNAAQRADEFFMSYLGRGANKQEEDAYYQMLRNAEKKNIVANTAKYDAEGKLISTNKTGELVSETDRLFMLGKVAGAAIRGSNLEKVMSRGGQAADDINNLMTYAANYGVSITQNDAMNYVANNLSKGKTLDSTKNKLLKLSKIKYSNIADLIDDEMSVTDLANDFIANYSALTGTPVNSVSIFNSVIQKALTNNGQPGIMKENDFNILVKTDPESRALWLQSPGAKDEAASYAYNILKTFGLIA